MNRKLASPAIILGCAVGLTVLFWDALWSGGGFIGGDLYPYFMPQKQVYQESLVNGELSIWNDRVSHGYPQLAESQTGIFYPTHPILYRWFDLNTAYAIDHLFHYVLAYCGMACFARALGLSLSASLLTGLVYTYGWFPARASLEWAIIGGAWVPWSLWVIERFLTTRLWRYPIALSVILSCQMLAGHFNLAFISLVLCAAYLGARLWCFPDPRHSHETSPLRVSGHRGKLLGMVGAAVLGGFLLAAIQLGPTWELKQQSQRSSVAGDYSIAYGNLPPEYLSQLVLHLKWFVLQQDQDELLRGMRWMNWGAGTNKAEAHLYFGLLPLVLIVAGIFVARNESTLTASERAFWWLAGLFALSYAIGWWLPISRHLPGFSFFQGPGRWGMITACAGAILAGDAADRIRGRLGRTGSPLFWGVLLLATTADLWAIGRTVTYAYQLQEPPIKYVDYSTVRQALQNEPEFESIRLFAPGQNVPTLLGVSAVPQYLGIGPQEYFDPELKLPKPEPVTAGRQPFQPDLQLWLQRAGVTHILSFDPLDDAWNAELISNEPDPFLNGVWGRGREPIYLYRLHGNRGRAFFQEDADDAKIELAQRDGVTQTWNVTAAQEQTFVVTELLYPGWHVEVDGAAAESLRVDGMFRGVRVPAGEHRVVWIYEPRSLYWGQWVSLATLLFLAGVAHLRFWHPQKLDWIK